jgi:hypothetical protein
MASTSAPHALYGLYALILPRLKTAKNGGIVGDANHGSGYHLSRNALKARGLSGDYSIQCAADKRGSGSTASAVDITFGSLAELILVHKRLREACEKNDPRIAGVRETIGTLDGKNVSGYNRVATGSGSRSKTGWHSTGWSDKSHLWHEHISILRDMNEDTNFIKGLAEVICGLARGALGWKGESSTSQPSTPDPVEDNSSPADPNLFPGTAKFFIGANAPYVTLLGQRLVIHGWAGYSDGPGPTFTDVDQMAVLWFQQKQGWTGANATGIPGPETWRRLMLNPEPVVIPPIQVPPVETPPVLNPEPPVEAPPVVTPPVEAPPVVVPPVETPKPPVGKGISSLIGVSFNAQWPGFSSTKGKAKDWGTRCGILASKVKAVKPDIIITQEMGSSEAASFYAKMGSDWEYQRFGPLNTVGWNKKKLTYVKTLEIDTPDYGQYPGRGYIEAWLQDKDGNRLRLGSGHNPVKTAADGKYQEATIQMIVAKVNDEDDDWPLVWGMDTNSRVSKSTGMWAVLKKYGYEWITNGIDAVFANFGAVVTKTKVVDLGEGSDHDMLVFKIRTTKR